MQDGMDTIAKNAYRNYEPAGKETGLLPLVENRRVLEIGFGSGELLRALRERSNEVYGVDVGADIVEQARQSGLDNVSLLDVSEEPLPFNESFFDAVYCYEVMEHLTNPHRLFTEIARVLKHGRPLFFSVPRQEADMGYGMGRHPFVYPGLFIKEHLERFFMQMYFRIEQCIETDGRLTGRSYVLTNMKSSAKPDIVKVVTAPHSLVGLYGSVLGPGRLEEEVAREVTVYGDVIRDLFQQGDAEGAQNVIDYVQKTFNDFSVVYVEIARGLFEGGQPVPAHGILEQLLTHDGLPDWVVQRAEALRAAYPDKQFTSQEEGKD